jgi:geranylgeranyl diphosphate synthase type I
MADNTLGLLAKETLSKLAIEVNERLERYWNEEIEKDFGFERSQVELVRQAMLHAKEHNLRSAKRLRASFVYYGYLLGGEIPNDEVWKVMEGVELVQTALLMHDDFMDRDKVRRGLPTTHEYFAKGDSHYGDSMAVNIGDLVLCLGYERVLECELDKNKVLSVARVLMRHIAETALGQMYDITLPKLGELTEDKVLAVHRTKTSIYTFQNPLIMGAELAGLSEDVKDVLKEYAQKGGVAFQLQDDILGMYGDEEKTGKSANSDLLQGKCTLLISKTLELGNEQEKESIYRAWGNKEASEEEIEGASKAVKESGAYEYSVNKAKELAQEAKKEVEKLEKMDLNSEAVNYLSGIAEYVVNREF